MEIKISNIIKEIKEEPHHIMTYRYDFDKFRSENKNVKVPTEDSLFFKGELKMRQLLGKTWRDEISRLYGKETPHLILKNLDLMFKKACEHDIYSFKEAERLWSMHNKKGAKIDNIVGFLSCESEKERARYVKSHGLSSNFKIFGKLFGKNVASKAIQTYLAHGAVWGIGVLGVTSPILFPVSMLAIGLSFIVFKTALTLPKELERLETYGEQNQMVLSKTHHGLHTDSLARNADFRKASFEEVSELVKSMDIKTKFALRNMSLEKLRNFADDVFDKKNSYMHKGIRKSEKEIAHEVYMDYQKNPENNKILKSGHIDTLKDFAVDVLFLSIPVLIEPFGIFEKIQDLIPKQPNKSSIDFVFRMLSKLPEFVSLYKETAKEHRIENSDLTKVSEKNRIFNQIKEFIKSPSSFMSNRKRHTESCDDFDIESAGTVFQMKSKEDIISKLKQTNKTPLAEAIENISRKKM